MSYEMVMELIEKPLSEEGAVFLLRRHRPNITTHLSNKT